ncbi:hypothetical protein [Porticoccus sp. Uisw_050_02]|uniref:hypothetical protein n=1 Tax=Porticoccus sp. Uisw_050_02 TaxID=3230978 RepID=UPI0039EAE216
MNSRSEERKSDLRNTTVMEVILAVIIVLLCFIYMKDTDLVRTIDSFDILQEKSKNQKKEIKNLADSNLELKKQNADIVKKVDLQASQIRRLKKMITASQGGTNYHEDLAAENNLLREEIEHLNRTTLVAGRGGIDKPRCSVGKKQLSAIGHIIKTGDRYGFSLRGDSEQKSALMVVPGIKGLIDSTPFTLSEFKYYAQRIHSFTLEQSPQCIFYVSFNLDQMTGSEIKMFERYFYKMDRKN